MAEIHQDSTLSASRSRTRQSPGLCGPVVHVSTARTWRGGEQQLLNLARGLQHRGAKTEIIAPAGCPLSDRGRTAGIAVTASSSHFEFDPVAILRIARRLRRVRAAVVHAHDAHATSLAAMAGPLAGGILRICTRRVDFKPRRWKYNWGMDHVICISHAIFDICVQEGLARDRLSQVYSGVDLQHVRRVQSDRRAVRAPFVNNCPDRPLILNVASLADHKGQRYLLEAMPQVLQAAPDARLLIVGEGELERPLKRQAERLKLNDACEFAGFRPDAAALLHGCDLFVMSSHMEGLCTSVIEAMAAGCAVVASRVGGLPELVEDGRTGLLVPPRDPSALARAIIQLLRDPTQRSAMGQAGRQRAVAFDMDRMVEGTMQVYEQVLAQRNRPS